jgi:hypothetical protein
MPSERRAKPEMHTHQPLSKPATAGCTPGHARWAFFAVRVVLYRPPASRYDVLMRINEYSPIKSAAELRRRAKAGSTGSFADVLDALAGAETGASGQISDIAAATDVGTMLALQEISDEEVARRQLLRKGEALVDKLEVLRRQLLEGRIPASTLRSLQQELAHQRQSVADPKLMELLDDIELRAAVELAKLEMATARQSEL